MVRPGGCWDTPHGPHKHMFERWLQTCIPNDEKGPRYQCEYMCMHVLFHAAKTHDVLFTIFAVSRCTVRGTGHVDAVVWLCLETPTLQH